MPGLSPLNRRFARHSPHCGYKQGDSKTSRLRTHGTWARKLIPDSLEVSQGTYELPPLSVKGIASDLVMILMSVGTTCLAVAVYGACTSRKSKKWDSVYDGASPFVAVASAAH